MRLADDRAVIAASLCQRCGACLDACPVEAIAWGPGEERALEAVGAAVPQKAVALRAPARWQVVAGAALSVLGREVLPRVADWLLARWDQRQRAASPRSTASQAPSPTTEGSRHRHRHGAGGDR